MAFPAEFSSAVFLFIERDKAFLHILSEGRVAADAVLLDDRCSGIVDADHLRFHPEGEHE